MKRHPRLFALVFPFFVFCLLLACSSPIFAQTATAGQLIISEFRFRGSAGDNDEFIEIYNNSGADHVVTGAGESGGYGIAASDGITRCVIPNGTLIPNKGHFLCANQPAYSLDLYADEDADFVEDAPDIDVNVGIALFNNDDSEEGYVAANVLDAVGSTSETNPIYREGAGYTPISAESLHQSFYRDMCGKGGNVTIGGRCTIETPKDTNDNAADFVYVNTVGTDVGHGQRLGAPGPENRDDPVHANNVISAFLLDATKASDQVPNRLRLHTPPGTNALLGTMHLRRRFVNNTGVSITRLRFRIVDITTLNSQGFADLRAQTSTEPVVSVSNIEDSDTCEATGTPSTPTCEVAVFGTFLEVPPTQVMDGGFNSTLSAGTVNLQVPLANGASINLNFQLGVQQNGYYRIFVNIEALAGTPIIENGFPHDVGGPIGGTSMKIRNSLVLPPQMEIARHTIPPRKETPVWMAVVPAFKSETLPKLETPAPVVVKETETPREITQPEVAPATNEAVANSMEGMTRGETVAPPAKESRTSLKETLARFGSLKETSEGFQLSLPESIWMGVRSTSLVTKDSNLASLATLLAENANYRIVIEVYTGNQREAKALQQLTQTRAQVLQEWLQAAGVAASRIEARSLGVSTPQEKKAAASKKALSSRTEITLILTPGPTALKQ